MTKISDNLLFQRTIIPQMGRSLDAYSLRQKAIANNIANVETESYQRRVVSFEEDLAAALKEGEEKLKRTHSEHMPRPWESELIEPELEVDENEDYFNGHNNVDIDQEMTELSRAILSYRFSTRQIRHGFSQLKTAITGTSR
jgi:flagellar basal-body rod protein FlgB